MFHLHCLKEPPPKRMCETINFTSEVEATISSQESQPPPIQRNKEQLTICNRWVDKELEAHGDFLGFYNVPNIGAETVVSAIKDVLLKLPLSLVNCRRQCYDGASNMMEHKTGVAKRIQDLQPKAYPTPVMDTHSA